MLHLKTFGGLSVECDGTLGGAAQQRKTLGLLALLAAAGQHGLSRDKVIAALWPETDAEHGRGLLRQACYTLRRDLQSPELFLGSTQLRLNPAVISTDVASFAAALEQHDAASAVACYRGPFLDGFYLNGGGEFEEWAETERGRLATRYRSALEALLVEAMGRREHRAAIAWSRRLLELDPISYSATLALMNALELDGERAEALRSGEAYAQLVRSELGTDPPPELTDWMEQRRTVAGADRKMEKPEKAERSERAETRDWTEDVPVTLSRGVYRAQILSLTAVGAVLLLLAGVGYTAWKQHRLGAAEPLAAGGRKMLAVLPFENRGPAADDYFADGLTESIGLRLGGIQSLGVIASQSARQYKGTNKSATQIGRELGVQYLLRGTIWWDTTAGTSLARVRVRPILVRVSDGRQLWAAEYDTVLTGMFALQTSLATKVAGALDITLLTDERRQLEAPTANTEAYDAFLRGIEATQAPSPATRRGSAELFQRAVVLDSNFVAAWAYLSITHVILYLSYLDRNVDRLRWGKAAADRATRLDPDCNSGSCCALGFYQLFVLKDYDGALRTFTRARRARPSDNGILGLIAHVYRRQGEWDKALAVEREAERLNPLDPEEEGSLADTYATMRQFPAANYYWDRARSQKPQSIGFRLTKAVAYLNLTGDLKEAQRILPDVSENIAPTGNHDVVISLNDIVLLLSQEQQTRLLRLTPDAIDGDTAALALAKALVYRQRKEPALARASFDSARKVLQEKVRLNPNGDPFYHAMLGFAFAGLERSEDAVREGERAIALLPYPEGDAESALMPANLARIHVLLGHRTQAIGALTTVLSRPGPLSPAWLRVDPLWDPLRSSPDFQRLAAAK
jgi:DNA-binding SARP family transcriptional activator/TolB-like protein